MWKKVRQQLEKNWWLKGWRIRRDFRRNLKALDAEFDPLIAKAKAAKNPVDIEGLDQAYQERYGDVVEPWDEWENGTLLRRSRKHFVHVPDRTEEPDFWQQGKYYPDWELSYRGLENLRRSVRDAERVRNDEWRKWATLFFAITGTTLAIWSLVLKTKQPDACQRNYYRNDASECVFALTPSQTQARPTPIPGPTPTPAPTLMVKSARSTASMEEKPSAK